MLVRLVQMHGLRHLFGIRLGQGRLAAHLHLHCAGESSYSPPMHCILDSVLNSTRRTTQCFRATSVRCSHMFILLCRQPLDRQPVEGRARRRRRLCQRVAQQRCRRGGVPHRRDAVQDAAARPSGARQVSPAMPSCKS